MMMLWLTAQQFMPFQSRISSWQGKWNLASQLWNGMKGNTRGHHFTFTFQFKNEWIRKAELGKSTLKLNEMKTCGHKFTFTFQVENGRKRKVEYDKSNLKKKWKEHLWTSFRFFALFFFCVLPRLFCDMVAPVLDPWTQGCSCQRSGTGWDGKAKCS